MDKEITIICPDLAQTMGFCSDCYRDRVRVIWPYLTCYCQCNGVGIWAELTLISENGRDALRVGSWKMKMEPTQEAFEDKLPKKGQEPVVGIKVIFE